MRDLILLHGAIGAKDQLQTLATALENRARIHLLNFSGHGGESCSGLEFSIPVFAGEVSNYITGNQIENADVFGYSMGGYVALYLAKYKLHLVNKIITLGTKFHWDEPTAERETKMLDPDTIQNKVPAFAGQLEKRHHPNDWKVVLSSTARMLINMGNQNPLRPEDYRSIMHHCMVLLGEKDKMVTAEESIEVANALPNGQFRLLPATPHPIEQVNTDMLAQVIIDFLYNQGS